MYIPLLQQRASPGSAARSTDARIPGPQVDSLVARYVRDSGALFARNATENANRRTGIIVGVVIGVFLVALCVFLFTYRNSVRFHRKKKRHHRHKSTSSKSSKSSKSSDGGAPPPPPPPED